MIPIASVMFVVSILQVKENMKYLNSSKMFMKNIFLLKLHTKINHGLHIVFAKIATLH